VDLDFAVLADGVTSRPDGKLDIFGAGFDTVWSSAVPARHARLALVVRVLLSRHETEHPHRLDVVIQAADGAELARARGDLEPLPDEARNQIPAGTQFGVGMVLNFDNVVFPAYGNHHVVVKWDGNEARPPLRLSVAPLPSSQP
jgi:hypothetical protein